VVNNLEDRLNKGLVHVSDLMKKIKDKADVDFSEVAKLFGLNAELLRDEWKYARRAPEDVELTVFASCPQIIATFPALSQLAVRLLLLPNWHGNMRAIVLCHEQTSVLKAKSVNGRASRAAYVHLIRRTRNSTSQARWGSC